MDWSSLIAFAAMAAVIEISPGPNFLLMTRSITESGKSGALANVVGFSFSYMLHGALAIYGVSAVLAAEAALLAVIQLAGAFYLLYLGCKSFIPRSVEEKCMAVISQPIDILLTPASNSLVLDGGLAPVRGAMSFAHHTDSCQANSHVDIILDDDSMQTQRAALTTYFRDGLLVSVLNPKITLFYMAAFPQFIQVDSTDASAFSFLLVVVHIAICFMWAMAVAIVFEYAISKSNNDFLVNKLNSLSGVALVGLSIAFFASALQPF